MRKVVIGVLFVVFSLFSLRVASAANGDIDWRHFRLDPKKIPQEKLDTTVYLAVSVRGLTNPYIANVVDGMNMFAKYLDSIGQKYETQVLDSGGSNDKEVDNMRQFSAKASGNGMAYADPNESAITVPLVMAMAENNNYLGTAWSKPEGESPWDYDPNWTVQTMPDNVANAEWTAEQLFEAIGDEGKVFVLDGAYAVTAAEERKIGFERALKKHPKIVVAEADTGNWNATEGMKLVEAWLNKHPDVKGIWSANDEMAIGALQALDQQGLKGKIPIVGIDGQDNFIQAIDEGSALATVASNGYLQGSYILAISYAHWVGQIDITKLPHDFRFFPTLAPRINAANVKAYIAEYIDSKPVFDIENIFYCKDYGDDAAK
jgi:ribose transport system substrate-binding protein